MTLLKPHIFFLIILMIVISACTPQQAPVPVEPDEEVAEDLLVAAEPVVTLRILSQPLPQTPVEQQLANEKFTPETGIGVEISGPPYQFVESKMKEICATASDAYDLFEIDSQWYGGVVSANCIEPLDSCLEKLGIDYDETFVQPLATYNGRWPIPEAVLRDPEMWKEYIDQPVYFVPWTIGTMILGYQDELLAEAGYDDPPATWDDFRDVARATTDEVAGRYGLGWYASRTRDSITLQWLPFLISYGAKIWDGVNWQADRVINSPEAVAACEDFVAINLEDGSTDLGTANWLVDDLLNGAYNDKYAMNFTWLNFAAAMDNPDVSQTAGRWKYAPLPCYTNSSCAATYSSQGIGINANSKNKAEACQYLGWLLSKDTQTDLINQPTAGFASARNDLLEMQMADEGTARWASLYSIINGYGADLWTYPEYAQLLAVQQNYLNLAYIGQLSCKEALDQTALLQQRIMDTSPNNPKNQ